MTDATIDRARMGDEEAFRALTDPYRRELQVHCYRILGSVQDAEDVLQETLVAAWDGLRGFEERSSLRTWLYRIATNRALNALRDRRRRPAGALADAPEPTRRGEPMWLQPLPDVLLEGVPDDAPGPDARYETKEAVGLAFVSGLQRLPPQQRAALVLRDVLGYRAQEVAEMLGTSTASVTSALQRAREQLERSPARPVGGRLPAGAAERELLGRFSAAFEAGDVDEVVATLTDDAWLRMPPEPHEYQGHAAIAAFLRTRCLRDTRMVATRANGQPAFGYYQPDRHAGVHRIAGILVLTVGADGITALTRFGDTSVLPYFGLPRRL
jgi:RNA polymerase sigma-70 factor (TIGR02960 family)